MIIQLTGLNEKKYFINGDHIIWFRTENGETEVHTSDGKKWRIKEVSEYIRDYLNRR